VAIGERGRKPIHPQYVARMVDELAAEDAIFSCDAGNSDDLGSPLPEMNGKRRLLGSFNHGSMANALPQQLGRRSVNLASKW